LLIVNFRSPSKNATKFNRTSQIYPPIGTYKIYPELEFTKLTPQMELTNLSPPQMEHLPNLHPQRELTKSTSPNETYQIYPPRKLPKSTPSDNFSWLCSCIYHCRRHRHYSTYISKNPKMSSPCKAHFDQFIVQLLVACSLRTCGRMHSVSLLTVLLRVVDS